MEDAKKKKKKIPWLVVVVLVLLLGAAGYGGYYLNGHTFIAGTAVSTGVTELDLRDKGITDIKSLVRCRELRSLDIRGNDVTAESLAALQEALPECVIRYDVTVGEDRCDIFTEELSLDDLPVSWQDMTKLIHLKSLTVEHCTNPGGMLALQQAMPGCDMQWNLGIGGEWYDVNSRTLEIPGSAVYCDELLSQLQWFPVLEKVSMPDAVIDPAEQRAIREAYDNIDFDWQVTVGERMLPWDVEELSFAPGEVLDLDALEAVFDLLPKLKRVDFTDSDIAPADRAMFREAHPELEVNWSVSLLGTVYPWDTELLDFNNSSFDQESFRALEEAIPYLPELKQIELCDSGVPYERLDELNKKYEDIKVVWKVYFGRNNFYSLRTDADYFRPSEFGGSPPAVGDEDTAILSYCTDMRGLDLGHQYFTDLHFLENMPHITYLIVAECPIRDISPLASLKELKYLEIFNTDVSDLSPLTECPALKALNVCYIRANATPSYNALLKMPQLEYLWWCSSPLTTAQVNSLKKQNPNLTVFTVRGGESSGGRWRYNEYYYEMRDCFHAWYMPSGTNGSDPENPSTQIIVDDAGTWFYLENYDGSQYWWLEERYSWMHPYIIGVTTDG